MATPTNTSALKADFREQIKAITPSHTEQQAVKWRYVRTKRDAQGGDLRTFHIEMGYGRSTREGIQSPEGGEYQIVMKIWTSYAGLDEDYDDSILTADGADLWETIRARYSLLDGFISAEHEEREGFDQEDAGRLFGAHVFEITYVQET